MTTLVGQSLSVANASLVRGDLALMKLGLRDFRTIGVAEASSSNEKIQKEKKMRKYMLSA